MGGMGPPAEAGRDEGPSERDGCERDRDDAGVARGAARELERDDRREREIGDEPQATAVARGPATDELAIELEQHQDRRGGRDRQAEPDAIVTAEARDRERPREP